MNRYGFNYPFFCSDFSRRSMTDQRPFCASSTSRSISRRASRGNKWASFMHLLLGGLTCGGRAIMNVGGGYGTAFNSVKTPSQILLRKKPPTAKMITKTTPLAKIM